MLHFLGGSFGSSPLRALNLFIFLLRLVGGNFGPWMIQASYFFLFIPHYSQIILCIVWRSEITFWGDDVSLLIEHEGLKWRER